MSRNEFVTKLLSPLLRECFTEILGAYFIKEGNDEIVYINYRDGHISMHNVTGLTNKEIHVKCWDFAEYGSEWDNI